MKIALVTGASRGIGSQIAYTLAKNDYLVIINYKNNDKKAQETLNKILSINKLAKIYKCDVSNNLQVKKMIDDLLYEFKKIDVLINNAGISDYNLLNDVNFEKWDYIVSQNLNSLYNVTNYVIKNMISNKSGKIVNITSMWGITGAAMEVPYSSTKAAMIGFTKSLAKELGPSNINVNAIACGVIDTDMMKNFSKEEINFLIENTPLNRIGTTIDIANAVEFLISEKSNFITGEILNVNGGFLI